MKPDWEGIALCLGLVAGTWLIAGQKWAGLSLILVALVLARGKMNRAR